MSLRLLLSSVQLRHCFSLGGKGQTRHPKSGGSPLAPALCPKDLRDFVKPHSLTVGTRLPQASGRQRFPNTLSLWLMARLEKYVGSGEDGQNVSVHSVVCCGTAGRRKTSTPGFGLASWGSREGAQKTSPRASATVWLLRQPYQTAEVLR